MNSQPPCWDATEYFRIIKPDAEELPDHVFRAIHCPTALHVADTPTGARYEISPDAAVQRFLEPGRTYVQLVVFGEPGTGKSHLIQWLRTNLPASDTDLTLTIPKVGISLAGIVKHIIDKLPIAEREPFEEKLRRASSQATTHQARVSKFIDSLAWSIKYAGVAQDADQDLAAFLFDLLHDPDLRRDFFEHRGTLDTIVQHIFVDPSARDKNEARREFAVSDLPLSGQDYRRAGAAAEEAIDFIRGEFGMDKRAIDLMNRALESAISQTINFTADDLIALMTALRVYLAKEGRRLILLIEDFSRLQGIDTALLQALITPPSQDENVLCELRWAVAVTTGYFSRLEDTVRSRSTFVVDMDATKPASLPRFTIGYLNAIRLGEERLKGLEGQSVPNGCVGCPFRATCHESFGHVEDIGLFPFTSVALQEMSSRTTAKTDGIFNPRGFINAVLEPVLLDGHDDLAEGRFPAPSLLERIGGAVLPPQAVAELARRDPANHKRRRAFLELWDGSGQIVNLAEGIHKAFGLPQLANVQTAIIQDIEPDAPLTIDSVSRRELPRIVDTIRSWANAKGYLSQTDVTYLRDYVFSAIDAFVNWDDLGFQKKEVCSPTGHLFSKTSINFERSQTQKSLRAIMLELPLPGREQQTAIALEALVLSRQYGGFDYVGGELHFAYFANELEEWSGIVREQLDVKLHGAEQWDPILACVEMLVLAGLQCRYIKASDTADQVYQQILQRSDCLALGGETADFKRLNERLSKAWKTAQTILRALCSAPKGGKIGNVVRAGPILGAVQRLRKQRYHLLQEPPTVSPATVRQGGLLGRLAFLAELYGQLKSEYSASIAEERTAWMFWRTNIAEQLGDDVRVAQFVDALQLAIRRSEDFAAGVSVSVVRDQLDQLDIRKADQALEHVRALADASDGEAIYRIAVASQSKAQIDGLLTKARAFLDALDQRLDATKREIDARVGEGLEKSQDDIDDALTQLIQAASVLEGLTA